MCVLCLYTLTHFVIKAFHLHQPTVFRVLPILLRLKAASIPSGIPFHASAMSLGKPASIFFFSSLYLETKIHNMILVLTTPFYIPESHSIITINLQV